MTIAYAQPSMQLIVGPAADKAGALDGAAIGQQYFEDDTGITYRKSVAGVWIAVATNPGGSAAAPISITSPATVKCIATLNALPPALAAAGDYAANDVLNDSASAGHAWVIPNIARVAGLGGTITRIAFTLSVLAATPRLRLHFFNALPSAASLTNDNTAFKLDADDRSAWLFSVDLPALAPPGSGGTADGTSEVSVAVKGEMAEDFVTGADRNLYVIVELLDAFTNESAGMTATLHVTARQD
jgi:hypothetical protein